MLIYFYELRIWHCSANSANQSNQKQFQCWKTLKSVKNLSSTMDLSRTVLAVQSIISRDSSLVSFISWFSSRDQTRSNICCTIAFVESHSGKCFRQRYLQKLFINLNYPNYYVWHLKCLLSGELYLVHTSTGYLIAKMNK